MNYRIALALLATSLYCHVRFIVSDHQHILPRYKVFKFCNFPFLFVYPTLFLQKYNFSPLKYNLFLSVSSSNLYRLGYSLILPFWMLSRLFSFEISINLISISSCKPRKMLENIFSKNWSLRNPGSYSSPTQYRTINGGSLSTISQPVVNCPVEPSKQS